MRTKANLFRITINYRIARDKVLVRYAFGKDKESIGCRVYVEGFESMIFHVRKDSGWTFQVETGHRDVHSFRLASACGMRDAVELGLSRMEQKGYTTPQALKNALREAISAPARQY